MFLSKQIYQPIEGSNYGILCTKKFHLSLVFIIFIIISCLRSIHVSIYFGVVIFIFFCRTGTCARPGGCKEALRWRFMVSRWRGREEKNPPLSSLSKAHQFFSNIKISTEVILEMIIVCGKHTSTLTLKSTIHIDKLR